MLKSSFVDSSYNSSEALLRKLSNGDVKYALFEENELQFHLYKEVEKAGLAVYKFYKNKYDIGYRLYGELKKLSHCTERYINSNPKYFARAYERIRQV